MPRSRQHNSSLASLTRGVLQLALPPMSAVRPRRRQERQASISAPTSPSIGPVSSGSPVPTLLLSPAPQQLPSNGEAPAYSGSSIRRAQSRPELRTHDLDAARAPFPTLKTAEKSNLGPPDPIPARLSIPSGTSAEMSESSAWGRVISSNPPRSPSAGAPDVYMPMPSHHPPQLYNGASRLDVVTMPEPQPGYPVTLGRRRSWNSHVSQVEEELSALQIGPSMAIRPCIHCGKMHASRKSSLLSNAINTMDRPYAMRNAFRDEGLLYRRDAYLGPSGVMSRRLPPVPRPHDSFERSNLLLSPGSAMPGGWPPHGMNTLAQTRPSKVALVSPNYDSNKGRAPTPALNLIAEPGPIEISQAQVQQMDTIDKTKSLKKARSDSYLAKQLQQKLDLEDTKGEVLPTPAFDCPICLDSHPGGDVAIVQPCGHSFCRDCLSTYVSTSLGETKFPISCPLCTGAREGPSGVISQELAEELGMTESQMKRWCELELAAFSVMLDCGKCHRSAYVDREEYSQTQLLTCPFPRCYHRWCKTCSVSVGFGATHSCDGQTELQALMRQRGWKPCPGCKTNTEKQTGCNHMTCTVAGCQTHWCYVCGNTIVHAPEGGELGRALEGHYKQQCLLFAVVTGS